MILNPYQITAYSPNGTRLKITIRPANNPNPEEWRREVLAQAGQMMRDIESHGSYDLNFKEIEE